MDVSAFMGGNFLTQLDLPAPSQVWTIRDVTQDQVGTDTKICLKFDEHVKPLGCNKINLRTIAQKYGTNGNDWVGRPLEVYRDVTQFQGRRVDCIRVRIPQQAAAPVMVPPAAQSGPVPVAQQNPAANPQLAAQPVASPMQAPVAVASQPGPALQNTPTADTQAAPGQPPVAPPQPQASQQPLSPQPSPWERDDNSPPSA